MKFSPDEYENTRIYGKAKVKLHSDFPTTPAIQVTFMESGKKYVAHGADNYPSQIKNGVHNVVIEPIGDDGRCEMIGFTPCGEMLPVRFVEFTHREDEQPSPKEKTPRNEKFKPYWVCTPILEVFEGEYKGLRLFPQLRYLFVEDEDSDLAMYSFQHLEYNGKKTHGGRLHTFLYSAGMVDADELKYGDNLLPKIQHLLQSRKTPFIMETTGDGWPHWFYPYTPENDDFEVPSDNGFGEVESGVVPEFQDDEDIDFSSEDTWATETDPEAPPF